MTHGEHHSEGDRSSDPTGWDAVAFEFISARSAAGVGVVRNWARMQRPGAVILDLGCGSGVPIAEVLLEDGFDVYGVDASPTLVAAFRERFPNAAVVCESVEHSTFFDRRFDAAVAVGLMFLLNESTQRALIRRIASVLHPAGQFLFSAPLQRCTWADSLTGRESLSLGAEAYRAALAESGLTVIATHVDEGGNHFYAAAASPNGPESPAPSGCGEVQSGVRFGEAAS